MKAIEIIMHIDMSLTILTTRNQLIDLNYTVQLVVQFTNQAGIPVNTDTLPSVAIITPSGLVISSPTTAGVMQLDIGKYQFNFTIPYNGPYGIWNDIWTGTIGGQLMQNSLQFVVAHTDLPSINSDGYLHIGDDPGFRYSQTAIHNINKLMKTLRARLNSSGKSKSTDSYGNVVYIDCDIFSVDMLTCFLANAISDFNQIPYFTFFTFDDNQFVDQFHDLLVEGATLMALASQSLLERGREYSIQDNGISFSPPSVSELLNTQYTTLLNQYYDKLKYIKNNFRHHLGLGTFRLGGYNPMVARLRHLRERRII